MTEDLINQLPYGLQEYLINNRDVYDNAYYITYTIDEAFVIEKVEGK